MSSLASSEANEAMKGRGMSKQIEKNTPRP